MNEKNKLNFNKRIILIGVLVVVLGVLWYIFDAKSNSLIQENSESYGETFRVIKDNRGNATTTNIKIDSMHTVTIETNKGTIVFETYDTDAPKTVENFITLANKGFYNGIIFHRVIEGFMIQGGDPTGTGYSGPGYKFADELDPNTPSAKLGYVRGTVAMANSGPNTNGSQFFIMHKDNPLPHNYTIFGRVISGMDVVDAIATTPTDAGDRPLSEVKMIKVTVSEKK
jgi:cyclophilin family peptidyl-prolyl cis-trans isomerase